MDEPIAESTFVAAQRGDGDAFALIWRELAPTVAGYLAARGVADPDGTTSDVFLAVLPRLGELTGGVAGLRTFVFSIAHARIVDERRRRARRPEPITFDPQAHDDVLPSAEQEAIGRLETEDILRVLANLRPEHREVLALRVVADLSVEQTAAAMRRSIGSVKQLQRRALLALRAQLPVPVRVTDTRPDAITETS